jgi:hypothetical protein
LARRRGRILIVSIGGKKKMVTDKVVKRCEHTQKDQAQQPERSARKKKRIQSAQRNQPSPGVENHMFAISQFLTTNERNKPIFRPTHSPRSPSAQERN